MIAVETSRESAAGEDAASVYVFRCSCSPADFFLSADHLNEIGEIQLSRLQGQKMAAMFEYKREWSLKNGTQRCLLIPFLNLPSPRTSSRSS